MKDYGVVKRDDQEEPQFSVAPTPSRPGAFDLDVQRTAAQAPRNIEKSIAEACMLVSEHAVAETMWYVKKVGGQYIEGPSARLAEILTYSWRNIAVAGNIIEVAERSVTAEGMAVDLERNCPVRVCVSRSIVDGGGRRYPDHLIQTTCLAAQSIAMRNAVFKVIPGAYIKKVLEHARAVAAAGDKKEPSDAVSRMLAWTRQAGLADEEVMAFLGRSRLDDVDAKDLARLRGIAQAIRDEETTVDEVFRAKRREAAVKEADKIAARQAEPPAVDTTAPQAAAPPAPTAQEPKPPGDGKAGKPEAPKAGGPARTADDLKAEATKKFGVDVVVKAWPHILDAAFVEGMGPDLAVVAAIISAPKTIVQASAIDSDPVQAFRQVAAAAAAMAQPKML